eukprot:gene60434-82688_t
MIIDLKGRPDLTGRLALVTGASRGIGYFTALELAKAGAHVIACARTVGGLEDLDDAIKAAGATVVGSVKAPLGTADFSSFVLQAQASGADVVAINNGGDDAINAAKAAREFGLQAKGVKVVALGLDSMPALKSASL